MLMYSESLWARPVRLPPTVNELPAQLTTTDVTLALPTTPVPALTTQFWDGFVGWVRTVTS